MRLPWQRPDRGWLFEVECRCGEIFKAPFDPDEEGAELDERSLLPLKGQCPWCGLRLEEIEPFGGEPGPPRPAGRSRA